METDNKKYKMIKLCNIVSGLMYNGKYDQLELLYKELIDADVIKPIKYLDSEEDSDSQFLMFKFLIAFDRIRQDKERNG